MWVALNGKPISFELRRGFAKNRNKCTSGRRVQTFSRNFLFLVVPFLGSLGHATERVVFKIEASPRGTSGFS